MLFIFPVFPVVALLLAYFWAHSVTSSLSTTLKQPVTLKDVIKSYIRIFTKIPSRRYDLPNIQISAPLAFSAQHLQDYKSRLQIRDNQGDILPPLYLCSLTGGFFMLILGHPQFPINSIGLVNTSTEVKIHEPIQKKWLEDGELKAIASIGEVQEMTKGIEFEIFVKVSRGDHVVWSMVFRSLKLKKTQSSTPSKHYRKEEEVLGNGALIGTGSFKLPSDAGRTYAKLSYDWNPIHIHDYTAKLFGFPKAIAHGMWVVQQADANGKQLIRRDLPQTIKIFFRKPSFLPAQLDVSVYNNGKANEISSFKVERKDKKNDSTVVVYGSITQS